jgi:2-oxoglutarate dehydrogenase E1 component
MDLPVFHVNADSMDDVIKVFSIAAKYRQEFKSDVFIDLIGYRRYGHNELDQPFFTQPVMYKKIETMEHVAKIYEEQLIKEGVVTKETADNMLKDYQDTLEKGFAKSKTYVAEVDNWVVETLESEKELSTFEEAK